MKKEIRQLQQDNKNLETRIIGLEKTSLIIPKQDDKESELILGNILEIITSQKWYGKIKLLIGDDFFTEVTALFDSGADLNCIQEGLIPVKYYHKTNHHLSHAGKRKLEINYKIPKAYICKDNTCISTNVKTNGYNYAPGSEVICVCYRIYYNPLFTLNPNCRMVDKPLNETIMIETNFEKSEVITRRKIKWEK